MKRLLSAAAAVAFSAMLTQHSLAQQITPAPASPDAQARFPAITQELPKLDRAIGDVTYILTPEQIEQALGLDVSQPDGVMEPLDQQMEQVEVRATRRHTMRMTIPFGLASIGWALENPLEAWRIFAPVIIG